MLVKISEKSSGASEVVEWDESPDAARRLVASFVSRNIDLGVGPLSSEDLAPQSALVKFEDVNAPNNFDKLRVWRMAEREDDPSLNAEAALEEEILSHWAAYALEFALMWQPPLVRTPAEVFGWPEEIPAPEWIDDLGIAEEMVWTGESDEDEDEDEITPEDLFRKLYRWHDYREKESRPVRTTDVYSVKLSNSPAALYRLVWLAAPGHVDFSDTYKSGSLIDLLSPCGNFLASVQYSRHELCIYFGAAPWLVEIPKERGMGVSCGCPGWDSGRRCISSAGRRWMATLVQMLSREWNVGGDIRV